MAFEDFTTYTEVDPNSRLAVTATQIAVDSLTRDEDAYIYKDFGTGFFSGDWEHLIDTRAIINSATTGAMVSLVYSNDLDDVNGLRGANKTHIEGVFMLRNAGNIQYYMGEQTGGSLSADGPETVADDTQLYLRFVYDSAVGTYGTLYLYAYTDSARTVLEFMLSVAMSSAPSFRYIFPVSSYDSNGSTLKIDGFIENLDLQEATASLFPYSFASSFGLGGSGRFGVQES